MAHYVQNYALFTFLALLVGLKGVITRVGKTQNQLPYKYVPSSGQILN